MSASDLSRRRFLGAIPLTVLVAPSLPCRIAAEAQEAPTRDQERLRLGFSQGFTGPEAAAVADSPLAQIIAGLQGQGFPCSQLSEVSNSQKTTWMRRRCSEAVSERGTSVGFSREALWP